jgi:hypothetical protein
MMKKMAREGSCSNKCKEVCSTFPAETNNSWPFRIKLTTDHVRWDSLKILPSKEFEEHILCNMNKDRHKALDEWNPVEIFIYDADTCETYPVKLAKKESFWFEPITPFLDEKQRKGKPFCPNAETKKQPCYDLEEARKEFVYSIEPFRQIVRKRNLNYNQEIGLRWSSSKGVEKLEFSVLYVPRLDLHSLRI